MSKLGEGFLKFFKKYINKIKNKKGQLYWPSNIITCRLFLKNQSRFKVRRFKLKSFQLAFFFLVFFFFPFLTRQKLSTWFSYKFYICRGKMPSLLLKYIELCPHTKVECKGGIYIYLNLKDNLEIIKIFFFMFVIRFEHFF